MNIQQKVYKWFLSIVSPRGDTSRSLFTLFKIAVRIIFIVLLINLFTIGNSSFGEWGDFFGGVLNPLLTFITFMGILITIVIQQSELRESRIEFKRSADALIEQSDNTRKQSFESTFFQMLTIHNTLVNGIETSMDKLNAQGIMTSQVVNGRDCFSIFYTRLTKIYRDDTRNYMGGGQTDDVVLKHTYDTFWKDHQLKLGHYYRYLYNIVKFVDESEYSNGPYIRLLRAQLSDQELLLLFYNCISVYGENFKIYIEQYALFDNLPAIRLLNHAHKDLMNVTAYGID